MLWDDDKPELKVVVLAIPGEFIDHSVVTGL
jgi:hypothetical protein